MTAASRASYPCDPEKLRTLGELVSWAAERHGEKTAWVFPRSPTKQNWTFSEIDAAVSTLAGFLQEVCPEPGDRVAAMLPNIPEFPLLWLAAARSGRVLVPINSGAKRTDTAHLLSDSGANLAITVPMLQGVLREAGDDVDGSLRVMLTGELPTHDTRAPVAVEGAGGPVRTVNIQYTSGTTGLPKGCMLSHGYWLALARSLCESFPHIDSNDVLYTAQPFSYMDPQWNVAAAMLAGARLVVADRFSARAMWRDIREHNVTVFYCLGMMPAAMLAQPAHPDDRNHHVRAVLASGIPPEMHADLEQRWGVPWFEAFGMTESGADLSVAPEDHDATVGASCIGRPHPGKEALVVSPDGEPVPTGQPGELVLRGVGMMDGYWRHPEATAQVFRNGWLRTGDMARVDDDGRVFYLGRFKDIVRRSGENVSAREVESVLEEHPAVRTAAVVPEPDTMVGEEVKVFLIPSGDEEPDLPSLLTFCSTRLAAFKVPRYWCVRTALPMTPSERVAKGELRTDQGPVWDAKNSGGAISGEVHVNEPTAAELQQPESITGRFRTQSVVAWDELDSLGVLHHSRYAVHVERAFSRLLDAMGYGYDPDPRIRPDRHHLVVALTTDFRSPVRRPGPVTIELGVERLGRTSLALGFRVCATTGDVVYADGVRTGVRVDSVEYRPVPWSPKFRESLRSVMT